MRVNVPAEHSGFQALGLNGRTLPFRKIAEGAYLVESEGHTSGIAVIRVRASNRDMARIIGLP